MTVIKTQKQESPQNTALEKIISTRSYIDEGTPRSLIHRDFLTHENLRALAVLDNEGNLLGHISRRNWFEQMARDENSNTSAHSDLTGFINPCLILTPETNPLDIWDSGELEKLNREFWFAVVEENGTFRGLFSSSDLLGYFLKLTHSELQLAHQIQGRLNRKVVNGFSSRYEVESLTLPAKGIGGDLVYSRSLSQDKSLFALIDVSGKGNAAALVTGMIYGILSLAGPKTELNKLITVMNRVIYRTFDQEIFATAVIGIIDEEAGSISLADMGHSHYYLIPSPFPDALSRSGSIPLGIEKTINPEPEILEIPLGKDKELLIVSDGILEQENKTGELYDVKNIFTIMESGEKKPLKETIEAIGQDFRHFIESKVQHDDASLLIVRKSE
ncbi:MAG: PP2C family protein-serine/threonine phosphatase [Spirochaetales bacterium]|nr:PP2C family protein-serine/threonine phosphatase [Spirochaetales bacterium]